MPLARIDMSSVSAHGDVGGMNLRNASALLLIALALLAAACGEDLEPSSTPAGETPTPPPIAEDVEYGVQYCSRDGVALLMDIYKPSTPTEASPAVLYLHPGIWALGNRNAVGGPVEFEELVSRGYVVATMDYSLAPDHRFPAQIEDAKCAVRYLRSHAGDYSIDPDSIAAWGASAGGHLAALLGVTGPDDGFATGEDHADVSSEVQAVVDMFGPADLLAPDYVENAGTATREVFAATGPDAADILRRASPVAYASSGDAPFLIIHGAKDEVVPLEQSQALAMSLQAAAVPVTLIVVENAEHGLAPAGGAPSPSIDEIDTMIGDFLDTILRGRVTNH
jgi:acetyl esterase/lipase